MKNHSPDVDRYIENAAPFAQPILERIRGAFHKASPEITEAMKWSVPHFEYKGVLGSMAAFKQYVSWGFWKAKLMDDPAGILEPAGADTTSMGFGKIKDVKDLPSDKVMVEYVRQAIRLNEEGIKIERAPTRPRGAAVEVPDDLQAALKKNTAARATFEKFSSSQRREYTEWLTDAKTDATRAKRLATTLEQLAEGKTRHWKYQK